MKNSGLIASKSLKLNRTQGPFNSWSGVQPVIANMLESLLFRPSLLSEKVHQVRYGKFTALKLKLHMKSTINILIFVFYWIQNHILEKTLFLLPKQLKYIKFALFYYKKLPAFYEKLHEATL